MMMKQMVFIKFCAIIFVLLCLIASVTKAAPPTDTPSYYCPNTTTFSPNSSFETNLNELLSSLTSNSTRPNGFYNTTAGDPSGEAIYGLFFCRGDITADSCKDCVSAAVKYVLHVCPTEKNSEIWYDQCMLKYANSSFFSTLEQQPTIYVYNLANASDTDRFMDLLGDNMKALATQVSNGGSDKKFATRKVNFTSLQTLYMLAQCRPDLSALDCDQCLESEIGILPYGKQGVRIFNPSCRMRYELYSFYKEEAVSPAEAPAPEQPDPAGEGVYYSCPKPSTFSLSSSYKTNLEKLLSSLKDNSGGGRFYTTSTGDGSSDTVYGVFLCRGDQLASSCSDCVSVATALALQVCPAQKDFVIWKEMCMLKYANTSFFSTLEIDPAYSVYTSISVPDLDRFMPLLFDTMNALVTSASESNEKFATKEAKFTSLNNLYTLAQCRPDLSVSGCIQCLESAIAALPNGSEGAWIFNPSCNIRYQLSQFYYVQDDPLSVQLDPKDLVPASEQSNPKGKGKGQPARTIAVVVGSIVAGVLICFAYCFLRSIMRKTHRAALTKNYFGTESTTLESLQFSFSTVEAATNKFSHQNLIGKGGFGEVYKGTLFDGKEIAVKRLSKGSGQGALEFKNEILLIAKLQHRNLVALLGFCIEEQEKILIYEYVANGSLDYFLSDSQESRVLNWLERYKIIGGIARGILYLHDYSRLKIIHRDLKPSNILLDEEMSPKISDFGLAKLVAINASEGSTNRIVGTIGYMPPEYAMLGQYSEKSDIFSFGVIVLEIISRRKNTSCHKSQYVDGLLSYAWKQWRDANWLEILDSNLKDLGSHNEVLKCIQIGLLCVQENPDARPSMATVVSYLSNDSIQLPFPQAPAFYMHGRMERTTGNGQFANNSKLCSINEMSISKLFPR